MASEAKGLMYIPVWVDGGIVKVLVNDDGQIPVKESSPLTNIQARLYGFDDPDWVAVPTETDGSLHVYLTAHKTAILVQQNQANLLQPGVNTYVGGSWHKQPIMWGYTSKLRLSVIDTDADVTEQQLYSDAVPSGEVWVVQAVTAWDSTSALVYIRLMTVDGVVDTTLQFVDTVSAGTHVFWSGKVSLAEGDKMGAVFRGTTAGDTVRLRAWGYKMGIGL